MRPTNVSANCFMSADWRDSSFRRAQNLARRCAGLVRGGGDSLDAHRYLIGARGGVLNISRDLLGGRTLLFNRACDR